MENVWIKAKYDNAGISGRRVEPDGSFALLLPKKRNTFALFWAQDNQNLVSDISALCELDGTPLENIILRLEPGASVQGTVIDSQGKPIQIAEVFLRPHESTHPRNSHPVRHRRYGYSATTKSNRQGIFLFEGIPPCKYTIRAFTRTNGAATTKSSNVEEIALQRGQKLGGLQLQCPVIAHKPAPKTQQSRSKNSERVEKTFIGLKAVDIKTKERIAHCVWKVVSADKERNVLRHDYDNTIEENGVHRMRVAEYGTLHVAAYAEGYLPQVLEVLVRPGDIDINSFECEMELAPLISGIVIDTNGHPVNNATVIPQKASKDRMTFKLIEKCLFQKVLTDKSGRFEFTSYVAPDYVLKAEHKDYCPALAAVKKDALSYTITLQSGGKINGQVTLDGTPVYNPDVGVLVEGTPWGRTESVTRGNPDGTYITKALPAGMHNIKMSMHHPTQTWPNGKKKWLKAFQLVDVKPQKVSTANFHFSTKTGVIEGKVFLNGEPMKREHVQCTVMTPAGEMEGPTTQMNEDGFYRLENVPLGKTTLRACTNYLNINGGKRFITLFNNIEVNDTAVNTYPDANIFGKGEIAVNIHEPNPVKSRVLIAAFHGDHDFPPEKGFPSKEKSIEFQAVQRSRSNYIVKIPYLKPGRYTLYARTRGTGFHYYGATKVLLEKDELCEVDLIISKKFEQPE